MHRRSGASPYPTVLLHISRELLDLGHSYLQARKKGLGELTKVEYLLPFHFHFQVPISMPICPWRILPLTLSGFKKLILQNHRPESSDRDLPFNVDEEVTLLQDGRAEHRFAFLPDIHPKTHYHGSLPVHRDCAKLPEHQRQYYMRYITLPRMSETRHFRIPQRHSSDAIRRQCFVSAATRIPRPRSRRQWPYLRHE